MRRSVLLLALAGALSPGVPYVAAQGAPVDMDKRMQQMRENVRLMEQQMDKIHEVEDQKAHHELLDEHAKTMGENVELLRGMAGPGLNETLAGHEGAAPGPEGGARGRAATPWPGWMQSSAMDMMQMMMEQIMRHQLMRQAAPQK